MQFGSATKPKREPISTTTKVKTATKTFASASVSTTLSSGTNELCPVCKGKHPLFRCKVFREKTPNQRAKIVADNKLCFSCFGKGHNARNCSRTRTCGKDNCKLTHNSLLHGADRVFPPKGLEQNSQYHVAADHSRYISCQPKAASIVHNSTSSRKTSTTGVKGLLQIVELEVFSPTTSINVFALCDSGCSHTWISDDLAQKLSPDGKVTSITVNGINCQEVVQTRMVEVNFCSILPDEGREVFTVNAFTKSSINVGRDFIDVADLKSKYPLLDPVPGRQIDYSSVSMILGQDAYEAIRPIEYFVSSTDKSSPVAVRLPIGWVLNGPLPSTSNLSASCFEATSEEDSTLARELKLWYDMETFGAVKNADPSSAEESRAKEILHSTTFHDG